MEMINMRCVFGIDVSKATISLAIVVDQSLIEEFKLPMNRTGFRKLKSLLDFFHNPEVVFEATGVYSRRLQRFLIMQRVNYVQLNPLKARIQLNKFRRFKTDQADAKELDNTQFIIKRSFSYQMDPVYSQLRDLSRFYQEINKDIVAHKNRLHRALQLTFPEIEQLFSHSNGKAYWFIVQNFSCPQKATALSVQAIAKYLYDSHLHFSLQRATLTAKRLHQLAEEAYPAVDNDSPVYSQISYLTQCLISESSQKQSIINQMVNLAKDLPEYTHLLSIPGLGEQTVTSLLGELGDIRRFKSSNALNSFIGIDLPPADTGSYTSPRHISKRGSTVARKLLFRAIQNIASVSRYYPNHINDYYQKRKKQSSERGTKKIAIPTMHRLIRTMYHLVKYDQDYDYTKAKV